MRDASTLITDETMAPPLSMGPLLRVVSSSVTDRQAIYDILLHSGIFMRSDAECVDGMFHEAFYKPSDDNYRFLSCWEDGVSGQPVMVGFACYGRESLTQGTWDLFWICVSNDSRRRGAGRALLGEVLRRAAQEQVRQIVIYTSSTQKYTPARKLYESMAFVRTATIPDYYNEGDDLYIYTQRITRKE